MTKNLVCVISSKWSLNLQEGLGVSKKFKTSRQLEKWRRAFYSWCK
jgi:hypothetical protein